LVTLSGNREFAQSNARILPKFTFCEIRLEVIVEVYREKGGAFLTDHESQTIWCYGFFGPQCCGFSEDALGSESIRSAQVKNLFSLSRCGILGPIASHQRPFEIILF